MIAHSQTAKTQKEELSGSTLEDANKVQRNLSKMVIPNHILKGRNEETKERGEEAYFFGGGVLFPSFSRKWERWAGSKSAYT